MTRRIGYMPLMAAALAGVMALSAGPAEAQRHRDNGWHGGPPPGRHYDRGYRGGGYRGGRDNTGAIVGGALLGLGLLGGALALQQSQVAPPPAYYAPPPPAYDAPPGYYAPPPGYYGYK
jgi:hypothetical protein